MAERVMVQRVCFITGLPARTVQLMASKGQIPGAAKLGSRWTFDEAMVRGWVEGEAKRCQQTAQTTTSISAGAPGTPAFRSEEKSYAEAYTRLIGGKRGSAGTAGSPK